MGVCHPFGGRFGALTYVIAWKGLFMRNSLRLAIVGAALSAVSFGSAAQAATSATATATAEVLSTLNVTADSALRFGQIAANTGGSVTVNADGTVASTGTLISTGTRLPAGFTVTGTNGTSVVVSLPTSASTLTLQNWTGMGPAPTMSLNGFNSNPAGAFQLSTTTGSATFNVGGTLTVASGQASGNYEGTFAVSVEYQ
jgi:hypothetical protein